MTISRSNSLFHFNSNFKLNFCIERRLDVNQLEDILEEDSNLKREYSDSYAVSYIKNFHS